METFKEYDVEKCKRHHYKSMSNSIYYELYEFINKFLKHGEDCARKTEFRFNFQLIYVFVLSFISLILIAIKTFMATSFDVLNSVILVILIILFLQISCIPSISLPKYKNIDMTLLVLTQNLRKFMWILAFTKFNTYDTWRESSVAKKLFKVIIEEIKYACTINAKFNQQLHEWINEYLVYKYDLSLVELTEKLKHLIASNNSNDEMIRILIIAMTTEINDIAIMFDESNKSEISEEMRIHLKRCKELWKRSLQLLLVHRKSIFTSRVGPNKTFINELISTVDNGLFDIEDKFEPITDEQFTTKSYIDHIRNPKNNFNDSLTAF